MTEQRKQGETVPVSPWVKLQTLLLAGVFVLLLALVFTTALSARRLDRSMELVQQDLEALDMGRVNEAVAALTEAAEQLAAVDVEGLNQTAQALKAGADSLTQVDVASLNKAVSSLQQAADTLKTMDMEAFNGVIGSLNKAVASLQKVSDTLSGLFGR